MRGLFVAMCAAVWLSGSEPLDGGQGVSLAGSGLIGARVLSPPTRAGSVKFEVEGCAAHPERAKDQPPTRAPPSARTDPDVNAVPGGVLVTHELAHACCLKANVTARVNKGVATVRETLSGRPCRCMCSSTLRAALGLVPGKYQLKVELEQANRVEQVYEQALSVP